MIWTFKVVEADGSIGERKMNTETVEEARGYLEEAGLEIVDDEQTGTDAPGADIGGSGRGDVGGTDSDAGAGPDLDADDAGTSGDEAGSDADGSADADSAAGGGDTDVDAAAGGDGAADGSDADASGADADGEAGADAAAGNDEPPAEVKPKRSRTKRK